MQVDQWNRVEDPEIYSHICGNLIFSKEAKTVEWKKDSIFNICLWFNWWLACRRMQIDPFLSPYTKLKFKWIKDLYKNPDTVKLIENKEGKTFEHMITGVKFLNRTPIAYALRS